MKRFAVLMIVLSVCVGCDQGTKHSARHFLEGQPPVSRLGDLFRWHYVENTGVFLGLGEQLPAHWRLTLFAGFVSLVLIGLLLFLLFSRTLSIGALVSGALILGGGLSNLIDRLLNQGAVVDFMSVGIGPLRTGIFNVADLAVVAGVILFVFCVKPMRSNQR
jgi:signal peptidase II